MSGGGIGPGLHRPPIAVGRLVQLPLAAAGVSEVHQSLHVARIEGERLFVAADRLGKLALDRKRKPQVAVGVGEVRAQPQRLSVLGDRPIGVARLRKRVAPRVEEDRVGRIGPGRPGEILGRGGQLPPLPIEEP